MSFWNNKALRPPANSTYKATDKSLDIKSLTTVLNEGIDIFSKERTLRLEGALLTRILYRLNLRYHKDKSFKTASKTNKALKKFLNVNFNSVITFFLKQLPPDYIHETYLPNQNMFDHVLIKAQGLGKLLCTIAEYAKETAIYLENKLHIGHVWRDVFMMLSIISRIFVITKYLAKYICSFYNRLLHFRQAFETPRKQWIPRDYNFPNTLEDFLDAEILQEKDIEKPDYVIKWPKFIIDYDSDVEFMSEYIEIADENTDLEITNEYVQILDDNSDIEEIQPQMIAISQSSKNAFNKRIPNLFNLSQESDEDIGEVVLNKNVLDDSVTVVEDVRNVLDDSVGVEDVRNVLDDSVAVDEDVIDDSVSVVEDVGNSLDDLVAVENVRNVLDDSVVVVEDVLDDSVAVVEDVRNGLDDSVAVVEDVRNVIDDSVAVLEDVLEDSVTVVEDVRNVLDNSVEFVEGLESSLDSRIKTVKDKNSLVVDKNKNQIKVAMDEVVEITDEENDEKTFSNVVERGFKKGHVCNERAKKSKRKKKNNVDILVEEDENCIRSMNTSDVVMKNLVDTAEEENEGKTYLNVVEAEFKKGNVDFERVKKRKRKKKNNVNVLVKEDVNSSRNMDSSDVVMKNIVDIVDEENESKTFLNVVEGEYKKGNVSNERAKKRKRKKKNNVDVLVEEDENTIRNMDSSSVMKNIVNIADEENKRKTLLVVEGEFNKDDVDNEGVKKRKKKNTVNVLNIGDNKMYKRDIRNKGIVTDEVLKITDAKSQKKIFSNVVEEDCKKVQSEKTKKRKKKNRSKSGLLVKEKKEDIDSRHVIINGGEEKKIVKNVKKDTKSKKKNNDVFASANIKSFKDLALFLKSENKQRKVNPDHCKIKHLNKLNWNMLCNSFMEFVDASKRDKQNKHKYLQKAKQLFQPK